MREIFFRHQKRFIFSQLGNVSFPTWECFVPNLGTLRSTNGNLSFVLIYSHSNIGIKGFGLYGGLQILHRFISIPIHPALLSVYTFLPCYGLRFGF